MVIMPSSTRSTRNQSSNSLPAPSSPTSLPVRATARKSMASQGPRRNSQSSATASMPSTSQTTRQVTTGGGSSNKSGGNSSNPSQTQRIDFGSDDSDTEFSPPARDTTRNRQSVALPSTSRSDSISPPPPSSSKKAKLSASQSFNKGSPSKQGGHLKNLISKCVSYILVADQKKHAIRKADIIKNVFEDGNANYSTVLMEANKVLKKTFGFELLSLKNQKNSYILINILDLDHGVQEFAEYSEEELQKRGLIFLLLTIIFMNENYIAEDKLWKALEGLGVYVNSPTPHPVFGNTKKYITIELVREMYLEYTRVNKDPVQYELRWGERAYQEVKKKDLLEFACNIMGDCKPQDWKLQFRDANPSEV